MESVIRRLLITGQVQGVGYRINCAREAERLGVNGWVRNLADGSVEVLAAGPPELVDRLIEWCWRGPRGARVESVTAADEPPGNREMSVPGSFQIEA